MTTLIDADVGRDFRALAEPVFRSVEIPPEWRGAFDAVSERPGLRPLARDVHVVGRTLDREIEVPDGRTIHLDVRVLVEPERAAMLVRHALELALGHRLLAGNPSVAARVAVGLLACRTTAVHVGSLAGTERSALLPVLPDWWRDMLERPEPDTSDGVFRAIAQYARHWLPYQRLAAPVSTGVLEDAIDIATRAALVAAPAEYLLTQGGDSRLIVDPETSLNGYGCRPSPRPLAVTFASCTASSISVAAFHAAEQARQRLLGEHLRDASAGRGWDDEVDALRRRVTQALDVDDIAGTQVILAASGTDCEYYALIFRSLGGDGPVVNVLVAPSEVGSGSLPAASGRHFDSVTPAGGHVHAGAPFDGLPANHVTVERRELRDERGRPLTAAVVDDRLRHIVAGAIARGARVLIHLVDSSKTGLRAPGLESIRSLRQQYGAAVMAVVDAAQLRATPMRLREYLDADCLVIVSGSKFYTGPPFSGALLVPGRLAAWLMETAAAPPGLALYATRADIPATWRRLRGGLPNRANVGLYLRWQAALWEMQAFRAVPSEQVAAHFRQFGRAMTDEFTRRPHFRPVDAPIHTDAVTSSERWDAIPTIFTFLVERRAPDGRRESLGYEAGRAVYALLNTDVSHLLPPGAAEAERRLAGVACHIGQPVRIADGDRPPLGAQRISIGARFISRVAFDPTLGDTTADRVAAQIDNARLVLDKIELITRHWSAMAGGIDFCR